MAFKRIMNFKGKENESDILKWLYFIYFYFLPSVLAIGKLRYGPDEFT